MQTNTARALNLALGQDLARKDDACHMTFHDESSVYHAAAVLKLPDLSYTKFLSINNLVLGQLSPLRVLKLHRHSISCTENELDALPPDLGRLQKLEARAQ